ncbi:hypothetical protein [Nonomuraea salmonea]|uniref:hypothetical protein n=1 Tax=Nonomuraea salmonea TaxID=46181 RepID=UPI002FE73FC9
MAAGLVMLLAAVGLQTKALGGTVSDPLSYTGGKGEVVDAQRFSVRLDSFTTARKIQLSDTETIETGNVFLIVRASARSSMKPYHLGQPDLLTPPTACGSPPPTGWTARRRWPTCGCSRTSGSAGRSSSKSLAGALPGARVVFKLPPQAGAQEPYRPEVEIDLGLDEAAARKLADSPQDVYSIVEK